MENGVVCPGTRNQTPRMESGIDQLSRDLLVEILLWLPGESLHRCKCVRKSWKHIINDSLKDRALVAEHFKRSQTRPSVLISIGSLVLPPLSFGDVRKVLEQQLVSICNSNADVIFKFKFFLHPFHYAFLKRLRKSELMDPKVVTNRRFQQGALSLENRQKVTCCQFTPPCDGIICYHHFHTNAVAVINPGLGRYRFLGEHVREDRRRLPHADYIGFGFDMIGKVYKVVRVVFLRTSSIFADIWTLRKEDGKRRIGWRKITAKTDHRRSNQIGAKCDQQVFCHGVYYWLSNSGTGNGDNPILSFDMHSETFRSIGLPPFVVSRPSPPFQTRYSLLVWRNERVILLSYRIAYRRLRERDQEEAPKPIESWVLKEDGCSWSKYLTVPTFDVRYRPLTFWNNGDELLLHSYSPAPTGIGGGENHLASYNIVIKEFRKLQGTPEMETKIYASTYVPSLIWI